MTEEMERMLSNLELEQLKDLADSFGIDCSNCELKEEYIIAISDSQKVTPDDLADIIGQTDTSIGPEGSSTPKFGEAEQLLRETRSVFDSGDYINTINKATEAIEAGDKALKAFYGISLSYAIRSSENMVSNMKNIGIDASSAEEILNRARRTYENQEYDLTGSVIERLKDVMRELSQLQNQRSSELMGEAQSLIDKAKGIGSNVTESEEKLRNAKEMIAADSLDDALDKIKESENLAKTAYQNRMEEISNLISKAGKAIEEAKYLNAPVSEAEGFLEAAKSAFDGEDYSSAVENADNAVNAANTARDDQIQKVMSIQERIKAGASEVATEAAISTEPAVATEAVEETEAVKPSEEAAKVCPNCGGEPTYVEQYDRYYCYTCTAYVEPVEKGVEEKVEEPQPEEEAAEVCPKCGGEPSFVEQYQKYYCYTCSAYVEPVEKGAEEKVEEPEPKEEAAEVCPKCGGEPTYVEQYDRYYCYTCSAYVEPAVKEAEEKVEKPQSVEAKVCPKCGGEPTFVKQYDRYYCFTCNKYL